MAHATFRVYRSSAAIGDTTGFGTQVGADFTVELTAAQENVCPMLIVVDPNPPEAAVYVVTAAASSSTLVYDVLSSIMILSVGS